MFLPKMVYGAAGGIIGFDMLGDVLCRVATASNAIGIAMQTFNYARMFLIWSVFVVVDTD